MITRASLPVALTTDVAVPFGVADCQRAPKRRVVVPLDGSSASEAIVPIVARLARGTRCEIILLHAVGGLSCGRPAESALVVQATATQAASDYLATVADRLTRDGFAQVRRSLWYSEPLLAISKAATREPVDLIAMATNGRRGLRRAGSEGVTAAVMRSISLPLLLARGSSRWLGALEHVVVPLDGSSAAATILPVVSAISEPGRTRIHFVQAIDSVRSLARRDAELYLAKVARGLRDEGFLVDWRVILDRAPDAIARFATQVGADLITMAGGGDAHSGSTRVALYAMNAAALPFLLLRPGPHGQPWPFPSPHQ
jgi:nucleotide-binding universal stress UspA family protein